MFIALLMLVALVGEASAQGDEHIWIVTTSEDPGPDECAAVCSLRAAISAANESDGPDLIHFDIRGSTTISPQRPLPALRDDAIEVDGRTQRGWLLGRPPVIYLDGRRAGSNAAGIIVTAADAEIRGLGIGGFARYGIGVLGASALRAVVEANWIGMSADGRSAAPNRLSGVAVLGGAADTQIGGACEGCGNRIAGNSSPEQTGHGVVIGGGGTTGALVVGNVIGLDRDDAALPNDDGVLVVDAAQAEVRGNVICASRVAGVEVRETGVPSSIDDNWIGVTRTGLGVGNDVGIFLGPRAARVTVGAQERNVVAGNRVGIAVEQGAREVLVRNNWVGLVPTTGRLEDALGMPNREKGISVIAGAAEVRLVANQVLAGERGIVVAGAGTTHISIQRNVVASQGPGCGRHRGARSALRDAGRRVRAGQLDRRRAGRHRACRRGGGSRGRQLDRPRLRHARLQRSAGDRRGDRTWRRSARGDRRAKQSGRYRRSGDRSDGAQRERQPIHAQCLRDERGPRHRSRRRRTDAERRGRPRLRAARPAQHAGD